MNDDFTPPYKAEKGKSSGGDGKDELVDCELEAAQALACLAHPGSSGRSEALVLYKFYYLYDDYWVDFSDRHSTDS